MANFFISFTRADRPWAEWIAWILERAGFSTIVQTWDFTAGENWVVQMQQAVQESERTIAVLSPDYLSSNYALAEWSAAFAKDPAGERGGLVPVRVREVSPGGLLGQVVFIDFLGLSEEEAQQRLLSGVEEAGARPGLLPRRRRIVRKKPAFPGASAAPGPLKELSFPARRLSRLALMILPIVLLSILVLLLRPRPPKPELSPRDLSLPKEESAELRQEYKTTLEEVFKEQKDYEEARRRFLSLSKRAKTAEGRERIEGLVIATYYGQGKQREGLKYICRLYAGRPDSDVRYRHGIHAFLRRIAINEGFPAAERVVSELRSHCQRKDLSYVWAGISLAKAEYLWEGYTLYEERYELSEKDEAYLRHVIQRYTNDAFLDHAYYFLHDFERIIREYSQSTILDLAYRSAGQRALETGAYQQAARYFSEALEKWPRSRHADEILSSLRETYREAGDIASLITLNRRYPFEEEDQILELLAYDPLWSAREVREVLAALWKREEAGRITRLFEANCQAYFDIAEDSLEKQKYREALGIYEEVEKTFEQFEVGVPSCVREIREILERAADGFQGETAESLVDLGLSIRARADESLGLPVLRNVAVDAWTACADHFPKDEEAAKALYLAGALERRRGNYGKAARLFGRLAQQYPRHALAEDALAEVGWFHFVTDGDLGKARQLFLRVAREYPDGNAADNALNWLAQSYIRTGNYDKALQTYQQITARYSGGRLARLAAKETETLEPIVASKSQRQTIKGIRFSRYSTDSCYVESIEAASEAARAKLLPDDIIEAINGIAVKEPSDFYAVLANLPAGETVVLNVLRGEDTQLTLQAKIGFETYYARKPSWYY